MDKIYIVILNYKKWEDTAQCLDSVLASDYPDFTVFIVDNFSQNSSLEKIIAHGKQTRPGQFDDPSFFTLIDSSQIKSVIDSGILPKVVFVQNNENKGFASGNNVVLQHIQQKNAYVWLLNPDMVIENVTATALWSTAKKANINSIIGATIKYYEDKEKVHFYGGAKINFSTATIQFINNTADIPSLDYISGGCLFCHATHFSTIGLLPEEFFLYWEETVWCYKAKQQGYQLIVCLEAICYDKISTTIGKGFLSDYYYTRNGLTFISRYKRNRLAIVLATTCIRIGKRVAKGEWSRANGVLQGVISFIKGRNESQ
jgi:GT2 family glycosyltransferase